MNKPVVTTPTTDHQIREIDDWWRDNRDKSPDLFAEELALAFRMLEASPGIGRRYPHPGALVRRVLLRASRNHIYYVEEERQVVIVAVWGAIKGSGPDLSRLK